MADFQTQGTVTVLECRGNRLFCFPNLPKCLLVTFIVDSQARGPDTVSASRCGMFATSIVLMRGVMFACYAFLLWWRHRFMELLADFTDERWHVFTFTPQEQFDQCNRMLISAGTCYRKLVFPFEESPVFQILCSTEVDSDAATQLRLAPLLERMRVCDKCIDETFSIPALTRACHPAALQRQRWRRHNRATAALTCPTSTIRSFSMCVGRALSPLITLESEFA